MITSVVDTRSKRITIDNELVIFFKLKSNMISTRRLDKFSMLFLQYINTFSSRLILYNEGSPVPVGISLYDYRAECIMNIIEKSRSIHICYSASAALVCEAAKTWRFVHRSKLCIRRYPVWDIFLKTIIEQYTARRIKDELHRLFNFDVDTVNLFTQNTVYETLSRSDGF